MTPKKKKYYLETNSLRQLSPKLISLSDNCFTSALAVFESISGLNEDEYFIRKKIIQNLYKSKLKINWDSIHTIQARAFPPINYTDHSIEGLKLLSEQLIKSKDYKHFINNTHHKNIICHISTNWMVIILLILLVRL